MLPELNDQVYRPADGQTYPAYVFTRQSAGDAITYDGQLHETQFIRYSLAQTMQAIVEPGPLWSVNEQVEYRGQTYTLAYVALRRTPDGESHHVTLTFEQPEE